MKNLRGGLNTFSYFHNMGEQPMVQKTDAESIVWEIITPSDMDDSRSALPKRGYRTDLPIPGSSFAGLLRDPGCLICGHAIPMPFQRCDARL